MGRGKNQYVVKRRDGWAVVGKGNKRATRVVSTKKEAIQIAHQIAERQKAYVVIQGQIEQSHGKANYDEANTTTIYPQIRAVYHNQSLNLLDPLDLPEGSLVHLNIEAVMIGSTDEQRPVQLVYPTRLISVERLDSLTGLVAIGGDAVADSEMLYE